jgi:peptidoglycan/LPS O-acetylase OafA/YrhL
MLVVSICRDSGFVATFLKRSPLQVLGQRSFSIYMLHPVVLLLIGPAAGKINRIASPVTGALVTLLAIAAYIALIVVIAGWSYARIESPSRAWFGRLAEPSRKRATPAAGPTKGLAP